MANDVLILTINQYYKFIQTRMSSIKYLKISISDF